jgi:hypothetical protein
MGGRTEAEGCRGRVINYLLSPLRLVALQELVQAKGLKLTAVA